MSLDHIHNVYFVGIGGIGMSALARYFHSIGKHVGGYDKTPTPVTQSLVDLGIEIHFEDTVEAIAEVFKEVATTLVVYTPAVPKDHKELAYFVKQGFLVQKRAQTLGLITKESYCFAVAGTHGKTTTSSILGHLLKVCNANMTAFLGGITENYKSNLILNGTDISVVEADEFDRSFMQLSPDVACITSMDADHLDIYGSGDELVTTFVDFSNKVQDKKKLFVKQGLPISGVTYGIDDDSDYSIKNIKILEGEYVFDIQTPKELVVGMVFSLPGRHNLLNALVAFAMAYDSGYNVADLKKGLRSFRGVERRFSYQVRNSSVVYIDDYAHHPTEINAVHQAVREMYPGKKIMVLFQPHLYSRTQDFADEFAKSLSQFDEVGLLDIYPARELPISGVTSSWLLEKIDNPNKRLIAKEAIIGSIRESESDVYLTLGAGDIGAEVEKIKKALSI